MSAPAYMRRRRQAEFRRMQAQLRRGVLPNQIRGDRDVLQAAMDAEQRACDVADDSPSDTRYRGRA